jgi:hypothetical protein
MLRLAAARDFSGALSGSSRPHGRGMRVAGPGARRGRGGPWVWRTAKTATPHLVHPKKFFEYGFEAPLGRVRVRSGVTRYGRTADRCGLRQRWLVEQIFGDE